MSSGVANDKDTDKPAHLESLSSVFANNKGADQHAHPRSLISTCVILILESIISKLATN